MVVLPKGKLAVIDGLEGFLIAESDNVLLICRKDEEHAIRKYVNDAQSNWVMISFSSAQHLTRHSKNRNKTIIQIMNGELSANNHAVRSPFTVYYIEKLCVSLSNHRS